MCHATVPGKGGLPARLNLMPEPKPEPKEDAKQTKNDMKTKRTWGEFLFGSKKKGNEAKDTGAPAAAPPKHATSK